MFRLQEMDGVSKLEFVLPRLQGGDFCRRIDFTNSCIKFSFLFGFGVLGMTPKKLVIEVMDDAMANILRQKTEFERLRIAGRMWKSARVILRAAIHTEHPDWNVDQVNRKIAKRISHGLVNDDARLA